MKIVEVTASRDVVQGQEGNKPFSKWKEALFLIGVTGISALFGFGRTLTAAKKHEPKIYETLTDTLHFEGNRLAMRALGWGTLYAVTGTGFICFGIWKMSGAQNFQEFRMKVGNVLPRISKGKNEPGVRTEFENLTDLIQYIIDEDEKNLKSKTLNKRSLLIANNEFPEDSPKSE